MSLTKIHSFISEKQTYFFKTFSVFIQPIFWRCRKLDQDELFSEFLFYCFSKKKHVKLIFKYRVPQCFQIYQLDKKDIFNKNF